MLECYTIKVRTATTKGNLNDPHPPSNKLTWTC